MQLRDAIQRHQPKFYHRIVYLLLGYLDLEEILSLLRSEEALLARIGEAMKILTGQTPPRAAAQGPRPPGPAAAPSRPPQSYAMSPGGSSGLNSPDEFEAPGQSPFERMYAAHEAQQERARRTAHTRIAKIPHGVRCRRFGAAPGG